MYNLLSVFCRLETGNQFKGRQTVIVDDVFTHSRFVASLHLDCRVLIRCDNYCPRPRWRYFKWAELIISVASKVTADFKMKFGCLHILLLLLKRTWQWRNANLNCTIWRHRTNNLHGQLVARLRRLYSRPIAAGEQINRSRLRHTVLNSLSPFISEHGEIVQHLPMAMGFHKSTLVARGANTQLCHSCVSAPPATDVHLFACFVERLFKN